MRFSLLAVLLFVIMTFSLYKCDDYESEPDLSTEETSDESSEETESPEESLPEISDEIKANESPTESNAVKEDSGSDAEQKPIENSVIQNARQFDDEEDKVESLCDNPVIHSADRLVNNTIRVYRNNHYWELIGLPSREAFVDGPHKIWWTNMAPVTKDTCTHTVLEGLFKNLHLKYVKDRYWHWTDLGIQTMGEKDGWVWDQFPKHGFTACYHDGNASGLGLPLLVAFNAIKVYYYSTDSWGPYGEREGYLGGKYDEHFPSDLTAAVSFPSINPKVKYYVYLFKENKYCFRQWKSESGKECDEWRENKELFGCYKNGPKPKPEPGPGPIEPIPGGVKEPPVEPGNLNSGILLKPQIISPLIVAFICLIFSFHLYY